jgi:transcriptional regulator with XRE-family HTH domain
MADFQTGRSETKKQRRRRNRGGNGADLEPQDESSNVIDVGGQLRKLRNARSLSLRALAEKCGLNFNTLSLIENGRTSPSVLTLQQIAAALQVPITAFFQMEPHQKSVVFQKAGHRPAADFQNGRLEDLGEGLSLHGGRLMLVTLQPHAEGGPDPIIHTGQEFVFCVEGELEYRIEERQYRMSSGDSLIFEAHLPHRWGNPGERISRSLLILCPADEHDSPVDRHFPDRASILENAVPYLEK